MRHLDEDSLRALWSGRPDRELIRHLGEACAECDDVVARTVGPELLDGEVDRLLLSLAPAGPAPLDEVGYRRLLRRLSPRPKVAIASGMAAALLMVALLPRAPVEREIWALKGTVALELELEASMVDARGAVQRIDPGTELPSTATIAIRYRANEAASAVLFLQRGQKLERLGTASLAPGIHALEIGGRAVGISLAGESGPVTMWLVAAPGPVPAEPERAIHSGLRRGLAVGRLDFRVRP